LGDISIVRTLGRPTSMESRGAAYADRFCVGNSTILHAVTSALHPAS
jgi:hypothetical protein